MSTASAFAAAVSAAVIAVVALPSAATALPSAVNAASCAALDAGLGFLSTSAIFASFCLVRSCVASSDWLSVSTLVLTWPTWFLT